MGKSISELLGEYRRIDRQRNVFKRSKVSKPRTFCTNLYPRGIYTQEALARGRVDPVSSVIESLSGSFHKPKPVATDTANKMCVICYCRTDKVADIEQTECNHHFHRDCLKTWKAISKTCPVCRKAIC